MLKSIRLENFKLHEKTTIDAERITVFIGPNNSGKSSIFQALIALRQAASRPDYLFLAPASRQPTSLNQPYLFPGREVIDIGTFDQVVRRGATEMRLGLSGIAYARSAKERVDVRFDLAIRGQGVVHHSGEIKTGYGVIPWQYAVGSTDPQRQSLRLGDDAVHFATRSDLGLIAPAGYSSPGGTSAQRHAEISDLSNTLASAPRLMLDSLHPIFPLRGFEEWGYPLPEVPADSLDKLALPDRAIAAASILAYDRDLEEKLSQRLEELLGIGIKVKLVPGKRMTIWAGATNGKTGDTLFANEGTGANQLPFILVPIALARPHETILLSEPEAHLHPKAQSELTALLLKIAEKQSLQLFIETHSEHVLHKLLHAVAKGELPRGDLAIYYFEPPEEGVAKIKPLEIDERGGVQGGLPGFYDQSLTELSDYLDALKKT